jgi:peptidase S24-like protein
MARRKTLPESVRAKLALAERLAALRSELFGERGGPEMARRLGIPVRTWYNYEGGVTVPAEVALKIIELTSVEPAWLLHGEGPKFRRARTDRIEPGVTPAVTIGALLRTALQLLENDDAGAARADHQLSSDKSEMSSLADDLVALEHDLRTPNGIEDAGGLDAEDSPRLAAARREWVAAQRENRCVTVNGDAMAPVVAEGASVAYARTDEDAAQLDGKLVVAWLENQPVVRWFQHCGHYALLRAENANTVPHQVLVDLDDAKQRPRFRRVLWVNTPH